MTDYEIHAVSYSGTTTEDWDAPRESDFDADDLSVVDDHFLLSESGFPPERFADLNVPVVDADGRLNLNALRTAYAGGHSVAAVEDLDDQKVGQVKGVIQQLAEHEFGQRIE
jgi:hypothetical protein